MGNREEARRYLEHSKRLEAENKKLKEMLRSTLDIFNAPATHHGGTCCLFGVDYLRKFSDKIKLVLK